ncbi:hypothetical protein AAF712_013691 [Marasmius tenuissimus]|uniref:Rrn9 domain-containing protein n=1 Tax=Marasmius tenuissimus TaxID=585030 RepID=A0ABR2ZD70_9AGAR
MPTRKLVPASQHAEFTEYASLLRTLRTNNILDVTTHLSQHAWKGKERAWEVDEDLEEDDDEDLRTDMDMETLVGSSQKGANEAGPSMSPPPSSRQTTPSLARKRKRTASLERAASHGSISSARAKKPIRDGWTRWPLLLKDVNVPEWSLDDEIEHLLASLNTRRGEEDEEKIGPTWTHHPIYIPWNRIEPIGWETVIHAFALAGGTKEVIENVQRRIQAVYGAAARTDEPSSSVAGARLSSPPPNQNQLKQQTPCEHFPSTTVIHRLAAATASRTRLSESLSHYGAGEDSFFSVPALKPSEKNEKQTKKRKREKMTGASTSSSGGRTRRAKTKDKDKE